MRFQELPLHKNPLHELRRASSVVPWIFLLGWKVLAVPATSAAPERTFSSAGVIMTKKWTRLSSDHLGKWGSGRPSRRLAWRSVYMTPTRAHTHTHAYIKTPLGRIPCFFVVTNNKYQKRNPFHFRDSLSLFYKYMNNSIWSSLYHYTPIPTRCMSGFLSFCPLNCILSFREAIHLFRVYKRHVRWEGTSQKHKYTCNF